MTIHSQIRTYANSNPDAPAILAPGRRPLSYSGLFDQIVQAIAALNRAGYGRGDRIALALPPGPDAAVATLAVLSGCVCIPLNAALSHAELAVLLPRFRVQALIAQTSLKAAAECHIPVIQLTPLLNEPAGRFTLTADPSSGHPRTGFSNEDELAIVFPTSGTTALPKLIPLTQADVCAQGARARRYLGLTSKDRCLDLMPAFHSDAVMASILSTMLAGASSIYPETISAHDFLAWARELHPTWCAVPPPFFALLLPEARHAGDLADLRLHTLFTCGAPVAEETVEAVEAAFRAPFRNSYGATECGGISLPPADPNLRKRGSVGLSVGPEIRIVDETGNPLPPGKDGEVVVRGEGVFRGYEGDPDGNANTFFGDWYRTGDRGSLDNSGHLFLTGRLKELINRGGDKIAPQEIEDVLRAHPDVEDAVAFAVPHATLGEDVAAAVVLRQAAGGAAQVRQFASEHLAPFKVPRTMLIVPEIPKGPAGKIQRTRMASLLAKQLAFAAESKTPERPNGDLESSLLDIWQSVLGRTGIGVSDDFFELGGDSLQATNLVRSIAEFYGRKVPVTALFERPTIRRLAEFLGSNHTTAPAIVPLNSNGSKPPLFLVFPQLAMRSLTQRLGPDQPSLGVGLSGKWAAARPRTLEDIAACLTQDILEVQPEPPHLLLGWGCGGTLAYEIAQQLNAAGTTPKLLLLIGTLNLEGVRTANFWMKSLRLQRAKVAALRPSQMPGYVAGRVKSLALAVRIAGARWTAGANTDTAGVDTDRLVWECARAYVPKPYPGRVVQFRSRESYPAALDAVLGWNHLIRHLEVVELPGEYSSVFQPPQVDILASTVSELLRT